MAGKAPVPGAAGLINQTLLDAGPVGSGPGAAEAVRIAELVNAAAADGRITRAGRLDWARRLAADPSIEPWFERLAAAAPSAGAASRRVDDQAAADFRNARHGSGRVQREAQARIANGGRDPEPRDQAAEDFRVARHGSGSARREAASRLLRAEAEARRRR